MVHKKEVNSTFLVLALVIVIIGFLSILAWQGKILTGGTVVELPGEELGVEDLGIEAAGDEDIVLWNKSYSSPGTVDYAYAVDIDSNNNVYVVGAGHNLAGANHNLDWWIKKFNSTGSEDTINWNKNFSSNGENTDIAYAIAVDHNDNVYVVGKGTNLVNIGSGEDWWIKKFNSTGGEDITYWNKTVHSWAGDSLQGIAIDSNNNVYVVGYKDSFTEGRNWYIVKYNSSGSQNTSPNWNQNFTGQGGASSMDIPYSIVFDSNNNIYVVGQGYNVTGVTGNVDWWIKKFNYNGSEDTTWNKTYGLSAGTDVARYVAIDSADNVYVVGEMWHLISGSSSNDWVIKKFNSSGTEDTINWNKSASSDGNSYDLPYWVGIDALNNVYVLGGGSNLASGISGTDGRLKKYDSAGSELLDLNWSSSGMWDPDEAYGGVIDLTGNLYVVGYGKNIVSGSSGWDWWIKKFEGSPTCGNVTFSITLDANLVVNGTCFTVQANNIVIDGAGYTITGNTSGSGVSVTNYNNITIKNFAGINNFTNGVYGSGMTNSTIYNNTLVSNRKGIVLSGANFTNVISNIVTTSNPTAFGISLESTTNETTLLNNNITTTAYEISDTTGNSYTNYFIYNNSHGAIKWINTSNGGFLKNLTLNATGNGIGLGINLFIGNNTIAVNTSAFYDSRINSSVNITITGLSTIIPTIMKLNNYSTNSTAIIATGTECTTCAQISYSGGIIIFNDTSLGSYAIASGNSAPNLTLANITSSQTPIYSNSTLIGWCNASDVDGDLVSYDTKWYQNSVLYEENLLEYISAGDVHTCGILTNGSAYCWGGGWNGRLGYGGTDHQNNSIAVNISSAFKSISAGEGYTCGILTNGSAYCWGSGSYGRLGYGGTTQQNNPIVVNISFTFKSISSGGSHTCGILTNGSAYCWGAGGNGQLGYGGTTDQYNPLAVNISSTFKSISGGSSHTCGILTNGSAYCWGTGSFGRLGYGGTTDQYNPLAVNISSTFKSISGGNAYTCGILTNGSAYCWGYGNSGRLGYGGTTDQYNPIAVNISSTFKSISAGGSFTCGILTNGSVYCWGFGVFGQLGYGGTTDQYNPIAVNISSTFKSVSAGSYHTCGILTNGTAYCWGHGGEGRLGYGGIDNQPNPIAVNSTSTMYSLFTQGVLTNVFNLTYGLTVGDTWNLECIGFDATTASSALNSSIITILNAAPVASSVTITNSDSLNLTNGTLTGSWTYSDTEGSAQSANETKWYNNSIEVTSLANSTTVGAGNTTKNENWTFSVRVYDSTDWSSWTNSSTFTIRNTAPVFSHNLTSQTINSSSTLAYDINCSDLDSDTLTYFDNTSLFNINSSTGIIIDTPSHLEHGSHNITFTCSDGQENVTSTFIYTINDIESPTITIEGPLVPSNSNTTLNLTTNEAANCSYGISTNNYTQMSSTSNVSHQQNLTSLTAGLKRYYFLCNDTSGNSATTNFTFLVTSATSTESGTNQVNATTNTLVSTKPTTNVNLTFNLSSSSGNVSVAVAEFNTSPETTSLTITGSTTATVKYITIEAPAIVDTINKITIKIDYDEAEVTAAGIAEADLLVYYYNTTSGNWQLELESAVNTVSNYVEVNVTHLSTFVLGKATVVTAATTTTTTSESGGGPAVGASSGVSIVRPNSVTTIWSLIYQGEEASLVSKELGINKIVFIFNRDVKGTILKVDNVESLPSTVKDFPREVYRLSKISPTNIKEADLSSAEIQFSVEKSWLTEHKLSPEQISLYRYTDDQWTELITQKISEDETAVYYQAETPGFSYFLIGMNEYVVLVEIVIPVENQPAPVTETPESIITEKKSNLGIILIGVVVIIILIVLFLLKFKSKETVLLKKKHQK